MKYLCAGCGKVIEIKDLLCRVTVEEVVEGTVGEPRGPSGGEPRYYIHEMRCPACDGLAWEAFSEREQIPIDNKYMDKVVMALVGPEPDGTEGQDRKNYTDDQDRETYRAVGESEDEERKEK